MTPEEFDTWAAGQKQDAVEPTGGALGQGRQVFDASMSGSASSATRSRACRTPPRASAAASNVARTSRTSRSRDCFAGCLLENDDPEETGRLAPWLRDPPAVKPGSFMPDYDLSEDQIDALVAYLQTLE